MIKYNTIRSVRICQPAHTTHHTQHVVVDGIHADLGGLGAFNGRIGQHQLERGVINAREVAGARGLVLFRSEGERVDVDTSVGVAGVVLVRLDEVKIGTFTLREAVLAVELKLGRDHGVLTPAVHIQRRLREDERAGIRDGRFEISSGISKTMFTTRHTARPETITSHINGTGFMEETRRTNKRTSGLGNTLATTERLDGVRERINSISVVEGLGTEGLVEKSVAGQRRAIINVLIRLNNPDQLLAGVVEVELDLVGRRTDGLITSELELFNQVLVGVLGHTAALIRVEEHVVNIQRRGNQGLLVGGSDLKRGRSSTRQGGHGPQALINRADIKVNLDFVVLKGNERKRQPRVSAVPELQGHVEGGFGEGVTGSANLARSAGVARTINRCERRVSQEGQLGGVTDHLEVTTLLLLGERELIPQVHPVTILPINALTTDFNFNLGDELLTREIEPAGIDITSRVLQPLSDFGERHLQVSAVCQITVSADRAGHTATKVGLTVERLLNGFHGKVRVATVSHLPEGNLRITSQIDILSSISDQLH